MQQGRYHVLVDVSGCPNDVLVDISGLEQFLKNFPGKIGMSILKGPVIAEGIPENPGLSGFVLIDYSHISIHTFTKYGEALVDVFSCKPYDKEAVIQEVLNYFKVSRENSRIQEVSWS